MGSEFDNGHESPSVIHPLTLVGLGVVSVGIYFPVWIYRRYRELQMYAHSETRITPARAAGFLFIPIFNIFWFFFLLFDLSRSARNVQMERQQPARSHLLLVTVSFVVNVVMIGAVMTLVGAELVGKSLLTTFWLVLSYICGFEILLWTLWVPIQVSLNSAWTRSHNHKWRAEGALCLLAFLALIAATSLPDTMRQVGGAVQGFSAAITMKLGANDGQDSVTLAEIDQTVSLLQESIHRIGMVAEVKRVGAISDSKIILQTLLTVPPDQANFELILNISPTNFALHEVIEGPLDERPHESDDEEIILASRGGLPPYYLVRQYVLMQGSMIENAIVEYVAGTPSVIISATTEGGRILAEYSNEKIDSRLAMALDGSVIAAPIIRGVLGTEFQISGFTLVEARYIATMIRSSRFPVAVAIEDVNAIDTTPWMWRHVILWLVSSLVAVVLFLVGAYILGKPIRDMEKPI